MKFILFNGSPAGKNSSTQVLGNAFLAGAKRGGAEVETVFWLRKTLDTARAALPAGSKRPANV